MELEKRVDKLEQQIQYLYDSNSKTLGLMSKLITTINKQKTPASRFVVIFSIILSTVINQLPMILSIIADIAMK